MRALLPLLLILGACGTKKPDAPPAFPEPSLVTHLDQYRALLPSGAVTEDECDAALFTALAHPVDAYPIWNFFSEKTGQWYRSEAHDCFDTGHSASDLSGDMALGLMWYSWLHQDRRIAETLWQYAEAHGWALGRGRADVSQLDPYMQATLAQLIHRLGGADHSVRVWPVVWVSTGVTGYRAHLEVLQILLRERLYDKIESSAPATLRDQAARQPGNPLFIYAAGDYQKATQMLQDARYWPGGRLPTSADRCELWLFQRDAGPSWAPCGEGRVHSGGDLIFLASLIVGGL